MKRGFYCVVLLLLTVSSCVSRKKLVVPVERMEDFEWMSAKLSMDINSLDNEFHFNNIPGFLRMRRDSVIWMSAAVAGMEVGRIRVTNDSLVVVNRSDKTYMADSLVKATTLGLPATLSQWQNLLLRKGKSDHVEIVVNAWRVRIRYSDIKLDEPQTFPVKINPNYKQIKL